MPSQSTCIDLSSFFRVYVLKLRIQHTAAALYKLDLCLSAYLPVHGCEAVCPEYARDVFQLVERVVYDHFFAEILFDFRGFHVSPSEIVKYRRYELLCRSPELLPLPGIFHLVYHCKELFQVLLSLSEIEFEFYEIFVRCGLIGAFFS